MKSLPAAFSYGADTKYAKKVGSAAHVYSPKAAREQRMELILLFASGVIAGICNATAGGGTLFTFPVLLGLGLSPVVANTTNAVAVWPAHALASYGYRTAIHKSQHLDIKVLLLSVLGGMIGAYLLLTIGNDKFKQLIPILILFATILFAFGGKMRLFMLANSSFFELKASALKYILVFVFAIYGGFFGAGLGVMLMALLILLGVDDLQENNALKNLLAAVITTISAGFFVFRGTVSVCHAIPVFIGCWFGGLLGVRLAKSLNADLLRILVVSVGVVLTVYYSVIFLPFVSHTILSPS